MMRTAAFLTVFIGVLGVSKAFGASLIQPGFGNGFINTPLAWNSHSGSVLALYHSTGGGEVLANSFKMASSYSNKKWEFAAGFANFGDESNTSITGISGRYNVYASEVGLYATLFAGAQWNQNDVADNSTNLGALLLGQKFRNFGVSFGAFFWSDAGLDSTGNPVESDFEATGNIFYDFSQTLGIFAEGYFFSDADKSGWAFGLIYQLEEGLSGVLAVSGVSDPFSDNQVQFGMNFRFR